VASINPTGPAPTMTTSVMLFDIEVAQIGCWYPGVSAGGHGPSDHESAYVS
jgi:hypothetical protein